MFRTKIKKVVDKSRGVGRDGSCVLFDSTIRIQPFFLLFFSKYFSFTSPSLNNHRIYTKNLPKYGVKKNQTKNYFYMFKLTAVCSAANGDNYSSSATSVSPTHPGEDPVPFDGVVVCEHDGQRFSNTSELYTASGCEEVCATSMNSTKKQTMSAIISWGSNTHDARALMNDPVDGVVVKGAASLFANGATSVAVQYVAMERRDECYDLIGLRKNVKVGVDEKLGAVIDAQSETCRSVQTVAALLGKSLGGLSSTAHTVCLVAAYKGTALCAKIAFVGGADTARGGAVEGGGEAEEDFTKGSILLQQCLSGIVSGRDYRTLPFRESKLTRVLQHPLHYTAAGQGHTVMLFCLPQEPEKENALLSLLRTAELCRGVPVWRNI